ncbi:MAG: hypothetical protein BroJett029_25950 [Alphaproteobacteria bacterium]|nr:MAG: hypothetical protein BroJett029_25950 [Alphaproteobacteria bacterium]
MSRVTREEIIDIVGRINDFRIAEIIATGATAAEVTEAFTWLTADEHLSGDLGKPLSGTVAQVYEILRADEPDWEEDVAPPA